MKEYTTFEIIALWKRAKDDPFILRYLSELTGVSVDDIIYMLECYGYQPVKPKKPEGLKSIRILRLILLNGRWGGKISHYEKCAKDTDLCTAQFIT